MLTNALSAIQIIIDKNIFKEIILDNVYVKMVITMIIKIVCVKNVKISGKIIIKLFMTYI